MEMLSLDRLGDEIAELSAHLDAATARLLDLIREFDARQYVSTITELGRMRTTHIPCPSVDEDLQ